MVRATGTCRKVGYGFRPATYTPLEKLCSITSRVTVIANNTETKGNLCGWRCLAVKPMSYYLINILPTLLDALRE